MDYTQLYSKIIVGDYDSNLVYPPFRTNRIEREKCKEEDRFAKEVRIEDQHRLLELFKVDLREYFKSEVGKPITDKQFDAVFHMAWEDGHSSGLSEVLLVADNLIDVVKTFVKEEVKNDNLHW